MFVKKCKYCGKEFESTPIYCVRCGASGDFLVRKTDKPDSQLTEKNKIENYDELVKEFLGDEYTKNDKWASSANRFEETVDEEPEDEYYSFLKKKLGNEPLNNKSKDEYYGALENALEEQLHLTEETTFNGIFDKEDTIENTFFKRKEKKGRGDSNRKMKTQKKKSSRSRKEDKHDIVDDLNMEMTAITKKHKKTSKKLWKMIFGLIALLALVLVVMFTLVNSIVNVNDVEAPLPNEATAMAVFNEIKNTDEASFLKSPQSLYISSDMDKNSTNQGYLKALYALVNAKDYEIKSIKKIEAKGASRAVVTYEVTGDSLSAKVFESLIFRDAGNGNFKLDFEEFILRYDRFKSTN